MRRTRNVHLQGSATDRYPGLLFVFVRAGGAGPNNVTAQVYAFRLDAKNEISDTCMFWKVYPCGGCKNSGTDEVVKTSPGKQWCGK